MYVSCCRVWGEKRTLQVKGHDMGTAIEVEQLKVFGKQEFNDGTVGLDSGKATCSTRQAMDCTVPQGINYMST